MGTSRLTCRVFTFSYRPLSPPIMQGAEEEEAAAVVEAALPEHIIDFSFTAALGGVTLRLNTQGSALTSLQVLLHCLPAPPSSLHPPYGHPLRSPFPCRLCCRTSL